MKQSRVDSLMESLTNIVVGLLVSTAANQIILPAVLGVTLSLHENLLIGVFFTVVSLVRSYAIRRAFDGRSVWQALRDAVWNFRQRRRGACTCYDCSVWAYAS